MAEPAKDPEPVATILAVPANDNAACANDNVSPSGYLIGYARVSTDDQDATLQIDALTRFGVEVVRIYTEKRSGKNTDRPQFQECLKALRAGDTLVVWRLDRLGRSLKDLIEIMGDLRARNVYFRSLTESIDTSNAFGNLIFQIMGAIAEFERNLTVERTRAGLEAARKRGRRGGKPRTLTDAQVREVIKIKAQFPKGENGYTHAYLAKMYKVSIATLHKSVQRYHLEHPANDDTQVANDNDVPVSDADVA